MFVRACSSFWLPLLLLIVVLLFIGNLCWGSVSIPLSEVFHALLGQQVMHDSWRFIVVESRLPQALTALVAGASLSVSGLLLQTAFRNPLAAPDVFGISSGASLMVALVTLGSFTTTLSPLLSHLTLVSAAFVGAMGVTLLVSWCSRWVGNNLLLIILGVMLGYATSSIITLLQFVADAQGVKRFAVWGMGSFSGLTLQEWPWMGGSLLLLMLLSIPLVKPLNALLLGEQVAESMGYGHKQTRYQLLFLTGILTAVVTAYCGPVTFIALSVPHMARLLLRTAHHQQLLPASVFMGAATALLCNLLTTLPGGGGVFPLNAVTPLVGVPVILYTLLRRLRVQQT